MAREGRVASQAKPLTLNLVAARLGRLCRERSGPEPSGTNRICPDTSCQACGHREAIGFEFFSHRQIWYACASCDAVWLGRRQQ